MMSPAAMLFIKLFFTVVLGVVWGYLTLYPQAHSDVIITVILPLLGALVHNLATTLNVVIPAQPTPVVVQTPAIESPKPVVLPVAPATPINP